jgi:hypothetical protein
MKEFHLEVFGGLCNRLRALISGGYLAGQSGRKLVLHWPPTDDCGARFCDLFTNSIAESDSPSDCPQPRRGSSPDEVRRAMQSSEPVIRMRECEWLVSAAERSQTIPHFESLCPVNTVVEWLEAASRRFDRPAMGVHVRRGDFAEHLPKQYHIDLPPLERYFEYLDDWRSTIFLATDGGDAVEGSFRQRYGDRVVIHPKRSSGRNTPEAIQDALVDVYLLQRCQAVIGTRYSSFSGLAWAVSGVPHAKVTDRKAGTLARFKFSCKLFADRIHRAVMPCRCSSRQQSA